MEMLKTPTCTIYLERDAHAHITLASAKTAKRTVLAAHDVDDILASIFLNPSPTLLESLFLIRQLPS